jgi:hypothetical protein
MEIYDLDKIVISPRVYQAWAEYAPIAAQEIVKKAPGLKGFEVPDEKFRTLPDGSGEIFIEVAGCTLKMGVPAGEWAFIPTQHSRR